MPFRTRDFLLFMVTVAFLVLGIANTVANDLKFANNNQASVINFVTDETVYEVEIFTPADSVNRSTRLVSLRELVKDRLLSNSDAYKDVIISPPVESPPVVLDVDRARPSFCTTYTSYFGSWSASNLNFEVVEGARILFRDGGQISSFDPISGDQLTIQQRDTVLQLPLQMYPGFKESCLESDVIGVALDGSLIRNNEIRLYRIFSDTTLIGYALDGFPIYGQTSGVVDQCGGQNRDGAYGYYLSPGREVILNCFAGTPVSLP